MGQFQRRGSFQTSNSRSKEIAEFEKKKQERIKKQSDFKAISIHVTSAWRDANALSLEMIRQGFIKGTQEEVVAQYRGLVDNLFKDFLDDLVSKEEIEIALYRKRTEEQAWKYWGGYKPLPDSGDGDQPTSKNQELLG